MAETYPLQILIASLAGWLNRRQGEVLDYLIEESRVPRRAASPLLAGSLRTGRTLADGGRVGDVCAGRGGALSAGGRAG